MARGVDADYGGSKQKEEGILSIGADQVIRVVQLYEGWMNFLVAHVHLSGQEVERPMVEHPSGSTVLAYDPERRVAFTVRQTRVPLLRIGMAPLAEAVAGVTEDETPAETALRECEEEIGVRLRKLEPVAHVWITPSTTTEKVHLFLGEYRRDDRLAEGGGAHDEVEDLDVREEPLSGLWSSAELGEIMDAKLFMLLQALRIRQPDLFGAPVDRQTQVTE